MITITRQKSSGQIILHCQNFFFVARRMVVNNFWRAPPPKSTLPVQPKLYIVQIGILNWINIDHLFVTVGRGGIGGFRGGGYRHQFDHQSGSDWTGIKAVDKRDSHGAHNWGSTDPQDMAADAVDQMDTSMGAQQRPAEQETDAVNIEKW